VPRRVFFAGLGALAVIALLGVVFRFGFTRETRREFVGPGPEASRNPYLAAARLLERLGARATSTDGSILLRLPDAGQTLLMPGERRLLGPAQTRELLDWVRGGGYLVTAASAEGSDQLLQELGLGRSSYKAAEGEEQEITVLECPPWTPASTISVSWRQRVAFEDPESRASWRAPAQAAGVAFVPYGRGAVTVFADGGMFTNDRLGLYGNAELLWYLATGPDHRREVQLVARESHPSLLTLLWHRCRAALAGLAAVLATLLWHSAFRRGPLLQPAALERRSIAEHVLAAGRFLWRNKQGAFLLEALRRERTAAAGLPARGSGAAGREGGERSFVEEVAALCEGGGRRD
jgi:hypothetical protein